MSTLWALISDLSVTDQDNSQDMEKKRYRLLCPESSCKHVTGQVYLHKNPALRNLSKPSAVSSPRRSKNGAEIVPFCGFVSCEVSAVAPDPLKWCQMSNLSIDTP